MKLYLIRHGQSDTNIKSVISSPFGQLTKVGIKQSYLIAKILKNIPIDIILTSPYKRAKQTAKIISKQLNKNLIISNLLREKKLPKEIEGKLKKDKYVKEILNLLDNKNIINHKWHYSNEENFIDTKKRTIKFLNYLKKIKQKNIVIIFHEYLIKMLLFILKNKSKSKINYIQFKRFYNNFLVDNGSIIFCEISKNKISYSYFIVSK